MLGAGETKQFDAFSVEEDDGPQIHAELHVHELRLVLVGGGAHADPSVVDEHIETAEVLAMSPYDLANPLLIGHIGSKKRDVEAPILQVSSCLLESVRLAGGDRQSESLAA